MAADLVSLRKGCNVAVDALIDQKTLLSLRNVEKTYHMGDVEVPVLHGIDLDLDAGELVVLVGPSGSGKSTLLNIIGGIDTVTAGEVFFEGRNLTKAGRSRANAVPPAEYRLRISVLQPGAHADRGGKRDGLHGNQRAIPCRP